MKHGYNDSEKGKSGSRAVFSTKNGRLYIIGIYSGYYSCGLLKRGIVLDNRMYNMTRF